MINLNSKTIRILEINNLKAGYTQKGEFQRAKKFSNFLDLRNFRPLSNLIFWLPCSFIVVHYHIILKHFFIYRVTHKGCDFKDDFKALSSLVLTKLAHKNSSLTVFTFALRF